MPWTSLSGSWTSPKLDVVVDMGHPFLNRAADGLLKIGTVAATKAVAEEAFDTLRRGEFSKEAGKRGLKKMCKEGAYWGSIAGLYAGMEYGMERIRGTHDWKNALLGGAVTGAIASAASNRDRDRVVADAITGGALATAAEFLNYMASSNRSSPVEDL